MTTPELAAHRADLRERGARVAELVLELEETRVGLRTAVLDAIDDGMSELEASKLAGVSRDSVRKWQGK